ncbi:MAG: iron-containing redox enzyme family protein [Candidatus Endonucleobacter sp. (ex Gigantidas childressi)]|nr:iron-containing redox enzyme family protein [Candidatus Endonucleobacter sp. (ex Gigantidas childressi)]
MNKKIDFETTLLDVVDSMLHDCGYHFNPYFIKLKEKEFCKCDFVETQIQFLFAVEFFSKPMAVLSAKIPESEFRIEIVRNVWEEHGEGDLAKSHSKTFRELLKKLDSISENQIDKRILSPDVRIFNTALIGACSWDDYLIGVGVMGIIERMFCDISVWLGEGIVHNDWLREVDMLHYNIHKSLDIKHSQDFFDVLQPSWNKTEEGNYKIKQGLSMGATMFNNLYGNLYKNRMKIFIKR